jgi:hypothetical protein
VVSDRDREMERITRAMIEAFGRVTQAIGDVPIETVVRFGAPGRELSLEIEAFDPGLVVFFLSRASRLSTRLGTWAMRRRVGRRAGIRVLIVETPRPARARPLGAPASATS